MESTMSNTGVFSSCAAPYFDCFSSKELPRRQTVDRGVLREMQALYQQPHLVEPMKLRVYEALPSTPMTEERQTSQWRLFPTLSMAPRPNSRASLFGMRKKASKQSISYPTPISDQDSDLPFRRRQIYRPLELSIYVDDKRLSNLPEFENLSFTDIGELKRPPKALVRTRSENFTSNAPDFEVAHKSASMFEVGRTSFTRPETVCSIVSTSRPPSEYDALHSHPVSWNSLPGLSIPLKPVHKGDNSITILTPMQEEFPTEPSSVTVDGTVLIFPDSSPTTEASEKETYTSHSIRIPAPTVSRVPSRAVRRKTRASDDPVPSYFHTNYQTQKRISQWLQSRGRSTSVSTVDSTSTTKSFAEHRRKRSHFYKLNQFSKTSPASAPQKLELNTFSSTPTPLPPQHKRTITISTITSSTTDTERQSFQFSRQSQDSTTTYSTAGPKSRTGTIKSIVSPTSYKLTSSQIKDLGLAFPLPLPSHAEIEIVHEEELELPSYLAELNGPLRSPGVGIAF